jgi:subtilisin family serine protease
MKRLFVHSLRRLAFFLALGGVACSGSAGVAATASGATANVTVVGYSSAQALRRAVVASDARVVRRIPALHAAVLRTPPAALRLLGRLQGITYAEPPAPRYSLDDPAIVPAPAFGGAYEWQWAATNEDLVPAAVGQAAANVTIAVIDSGADVTAPDIAAKAPATWSVLTGTPDVADTVGHGTFVSSLAAGSSTNDEGVAGFGGEAKLLVVQAGGALLSSADIASALVYAVDHGAKVINLSFGGEDSSTIEQDAIDYGAGHGALVVAAAGNSGAAGNPPIYPAAYVQPLGSNGAGGVGLAVGATDLGGARASFSSYGSYVSLSAPGEHVFGALSAAAGWTETPLPGSHAGSYGYSNGTSFAAPEVAGAAALVWAANPQLSPPDVAEVLKQTASGHGSWNQETGYGLLDAGAAVERAREIVVTPPTVTLTGVQSGNHVSLSWGAPKAARYRLDVARDGGAAQVLVGGTASTSTATDLERGHTYSFTVTATTPWGASYTSSPYVVSLPYSAVTVTLKAARVGSRAGRTVRLWAIFAPAEPRFARGRRTIGFDAFNGRRWIRFGRASTNSTGIAAWTGNIRHGTYLLRAVYTGADTLGAATSRSLRFRVR